MKLYLAINDTKFYKLYQVDRVLVEVVHVVTTVVVDVVVEVPIESTITLIIIPI